MRLSRDWLARAHGRVPAGTEVAMWRTAADVIAAVRAGEPATPDELRAALVLLAEVETNLRHCLQGLAGAVLDKRHTATVRAEDAGQTLTRTTSMLQRHVGSKT